MIKDTETTEISNRKKWSVISKHVAPAQYSYWGIKPGLIPAFFELYGREVLGEVRGASEHLTISYGTLKKLVAFLHGEGFNTSDLSQALETAIQTRRRSASSQQQTDGISLDFRKAVEERYANTPVVVKDDLQKSRWGGSSMANGLELSATVIETSVPRLYKVEAMVTSANMKRALQGAVAFFLHDSFKQEVEYVECKGGKARLTIDFCYEAFTLAAFTENGTTLELDLNVLSGFPEGFYWNDTTNFKERVKALYDRKLVGVKDDLQKGRWGGQKEVGDKVLSATVTSSWVRGFFSVQLKVTELGAAANGSETEAAFFLHDSFPRQIRFARFINNQAELKITSYQAFTVGVLLEDGTELELDLNEQPGFPKAFYY